MDRAKLLLGRVIYLLIGLLFLGAGVGLEAGVGAETLLKFQIDPARSDVRFDGETRLHNLDGVAKAFQGEMEAPASLFGEGVSGRVVIDPSSIDTGNSLRDRQMRNRTLEVEKFPEIVFLIDGAESEGETVAQADSMNLILSGRLVLHGITQEKRFSVTVLREGEELVLSGRFSLHLSEHQIPDPSTFFNHVRDELIAIFKFTLIPTE